MDSNLTDGGYGYDIVIAVTARSLNATLKQYIANILPEPIIQAYEGNYNSISYDLLMKKINGATPPSSPEYINLFNIDPQNPKEKEIEALKKATEIGVEYVMKIRFINPDIRTPDLIELVPSKNNIIYRAYFAEFEILIIDKNTPSIKRITQPVQDPWIFGYQIDLSLKPSEFTNLPIDIQYKIKSNHPEVEDFDSDFSIQELVLNLQDSTLIFEPPNAPTENYDVIKKLFLDNYIKLLLEKKGIGGSVWGYTIKNKKQLNNNSEGSVINPTDYDFSMSEFSDKERLDLYTLNYLVVCDNKPLPQEKKPFSWDWVDKDSSVHGVMAISSGKIFELLNHIFKPQVSCLTLYPEIHIVEIGCYQGFSYNMRTDGTVIVNFSIAHTNTDKILFYGNYIRSSEDSSSFLFWTNKIKVQYELNSSIVMRDDEIFSNADIQAFLYLDYEGKYFNERIYQNLINYKIKLSVDENGFIKLNATPYEYNDLLSNDTKDNKIDLTSTVKNIISYYTEQINSAVNTYKQVAFNRIDNTNNWILPINKTFISKDIKFSTYKDLIINLTYTQPSKEKEI